MSTYTSQKRTNPEPAESKASIMHRDESPRPVKRRRTASLEADLLTPPQETEDTLFTPRTTEDKSLDDNDDDDDDNSLLNHAAYVLATEAAALASVTELYRTNATARHNFSQAVKTITASQRDRGKLIVTGVGKSAYIGQKLVATCKSLGVAASFMHACEAAHGDLGDVRDGDTLLFITYSGATPELLNLLPHIPSTIPILALSSHTTPSTCPILTSRPPSSTKILLPAPIPLSEGCTFGVSAPTTSTTVSLAVADMLALTLAERVHSSGGGGGGKREVFRRNHPGGAIGISHQREVEVVETKKVKVEVEMLELPSPSISGSDEG